MRRFTAAFIVAVCCFVSAASASASSKVKALVPVPGLEKFGLSGACAVRANGRGVMGTMRNRRFVAGIPHDRKRRRQFASAARRVRKACTKLARGYKGTGTPAASGTSGSPAANPQGEAQAGNSDGTVKPSASLNFPPIPMLAQWESNMLQYGRKNCEFLKTHAGTADERLMATYYDAEWVFWQIGDYTGDSSWTECAQAAEQAYRDEYVLANGGKVPGYWSFGHGLLEDYQRTGDSQSREAVALLAKQAAFAPDDTPLSYTEKAEASREVSYVIMAYLNAEAAGEPKRARLAQMVDQALGHLDQWTVSHTAPYVRPFMISLTSYALIQYQEATGDPRIVPALVQAIDWMWDTMWLSDQQAFKYTDRQTGAGGTEPAPDLNLLIAPVFAWLYRQTGEVRFQERGDAVFAGGVKAAFLSYGKQFDQNYRRSIEFVRLRSGK